MALYTLARPLLFLLEAEKAHRATISALKFSPIRGPQPSNPLLASTVAGLQFPNPVGLAAGFDKDADVPDAMLGMGFGFVEIGTVTPLPQPGNPIPRVFRLVPDRGVINRMGFNSGGQKVALEKLKRRVRRGIVGVNVGANKDSVDRIADYEIGVRQMAPVADYLTMNISSPNTPGLRALQDRGAIDDLLVRTMAARGEKGPPLFLKVAPDLEQADIDNISQCAIDRGIDGIIIGNTTIIRQPSLRSPEALEEGGLSGEPLHDLALERLRDFRKATGGRIPIISAGGIASAEQAYGRIKAGASLVQLYSALVFEGPGLAKRIVSGMEKLLRRDGFTSLDQAIGSEAR